MEKDKLMKYKFVICGSTGYYEIGYHDIMDLPNVVYHKSDISGVESFFMQNLIMINFSRKINKCIKYPLAKYVYPRLYPHTFKKDELICFLFFGNVEHVFQSSYLQYLRKTYTNIKLVLFMQDLVHRNQRLDFEYCKHYFDLILSYDKGDCEKYNLLFHPTPMSKVKVERDLSLRESDVYFCGFAKSRYPIINDLYLKLTALGLKCDFHLMQYPENEQRIDGIYYNEPLFDYNKNIQHVLNTRCVLEVMQEGADGYTPRVWESIVYKRHLLTNNTMLHNSEFYNAANMHNMSDDNILDWIYTSANYSAEEQERLSPIHLLEFIEDQLLKL